LRDRIEGRPARSAPVGEPIEDEEVDADRDETSDEAEAAWTGKSRDVSQADLTDDALISAKTLLADAVEAFMDVLRAPGVVHDISAVDRANLAKYLLI